MDIKNYLKAAERRGQGFSNAGGNFRNAGGNRMHNTMGPNGGFPTRNNGWGTQGMQNAGGPSGTVGDQPTSDPYIITITAASTVTQQTFNLFFADTNLYGFQYPSAAAGLTNASGPGFYQGVWYPAPGISVSTAFVGSGATYQYLLSQSKTKPFLIGRTELFATSGLNTTGQATTPITWQQLNADNTQAQKTLIFKTDIQQYILTQTVNKQQYMLDGNSGLTFTQLTAGSTGSLSQIYFYPAIIADVSSALGGNNGIQQYGAPSSPLSAVRIVGS